MDEFDDSSNIGRNVETEANIDKSGAKKSVEKCTNCRDNGCEEVKEIQFDTTFCCEYAVRKNMIDFCDKHHHAFQVKSTQRDNEEKGIRAKIVYKCTHGVDRSKQPKRKTSNTRTKQFHNFTGCTAGVTIRKQQDDRWAVRTCILDHVTSTGVIAHSVG